MSETDTLDELRAKVLGVVDNPLPASAYGNTTAEEMKAFLKSCETVRPTRTPEQKAVLRSMRADDYTSDFSDEEVSVEYIDFLISTDDEDPGTSDDESSSKQEEAFSSAPEEEADVRDIDLAGPSEAEHDAAGTDAQVDAPHDKVALSKVSSDRSADSDCFEAGTLLSSLSSAAPSIDLGQTAKPSIAADSRRVAAEKLGLETLRQAAQ